MASRPIRFRAWDIRRKRMVDEDGEYGIADEMYADTWGMFTSNLQELLDDRHVVLMQFTGLTDRNGKEIYEGDVLGDEYSKYEVRYEGDCFVVRLSKSETGSVMWLMHGRPVEVIGNIYENPELIEKSV